MSSVIRICMLLNNLLRRVSDMMMLLIRGLICWWDFIYSSWEKRLIYSSWWFIPCFAAHRSGNVGVIHVIDNQRDLDWLLDNATADPYISVIQPDMFTRYMSWLILGFCNSVRYVYEVYVMADSGLSQCLAVDVVSVLECLHLCIWAMVCGHRNSCTLYTFVLKIKVAWTSSRSATMFIFTWCKHPKAELSSVDTMS
jgi:hypothetical protein